MNSLKEKDGKASFSRLMGAAVIVVLCAVFLVATAFQEWETVRFMAADLSLLAAGLYGFNKVTGIWQVKPKEEV